MAAPPPLVKPLALDGITGGEPRSPGAGDGFAASPPPSGLGGAGSVSPQRRRQQRQLKKKPAIRLHVHILDKSFPMNVGRGTQDLKWLATVAAQRFDRLARPNGRTRQREVVRAGAANCRVVLPAEVRTPRASPRPGAAAGDDGSGGGGWPYDFVHPKTRIRDVLRTGDHVEIVVDLDRAARGVAPALQKEKAWSRVHDSGFQDYAFRNSTTSLEYRLQQEKIIRDRAARLREGQAMLRREIANQLFGADVNTSPEEIQRAFEEELKEMAMPMFIRGAKQRNAVNAALREAYDDICLTFRYYGGLGNKADVIENAEQSLRKPREDADDDNEETISFSEFMTFVKQSRIWHEEKGGPPPIGSHGNGIITMQTLKEIFRVVNSKMEASGGGGGSKFRVRGDDELDRAEFMEALVHLARHKYSKEFENDGSEQLYHLLTEFIAKHAKHLVPNEFRAQLASSDSAQLILDNLEVFRFVFDRYADARSKTMGRNAFVRLLLDIGMMAPDNKEKNKYKRRPVKEDPVDPGSLTLDDVKRLLIDVNKETFAESSAADQERGSTRTGSPGSWREGSAVAAAFVDFNQPLGSSRHSNPLGTGAGRTNSGPPERGLVFVEFIEAVARAGNLRWRFEADDLDHRIETSIQQLRRQQFEQTNRRYLPSGTRNSQEKSRR